MVAKKSFIVLLLLTTLLLTSSAFAAETDCVYYFYGDECEQCVQANAYLDELETSHPGLNIQRFEVHYNRENAHALEQYLDAYQISDKSEGVPLALIAGSYFVGPNAITTLLESRIKENNLQGCPSLEDPVWYGVVGDKTTGDALKLLSAPHLIGKALLKAFTLQMVVVWIILLILIVAIHGKKTIQKHGLLFVGGVYLSLLLFNFGILPALGNASVVFYKIIALIGVAYGIIGGTRFFNPNAFTFSGKIMKRLQHYKAEFLSPIGMFVIGFLVTYLSNARVSNLVSLLRVLSTEFPFHVLWKVLYYALIVALPPLILIFVVDKIKDKLERHATKKGKNDIMTQKWKEYNHKIFHLTICGVAVVVGFVLLFV